MLVGVGCTSVIPIPHLQFFVNVMKKVICVKVFGNVMFACVKVYFSANSHEHILIII